MKVYSIFLVAVMARFSHLVADAIFLSPKVGFKVVDVACFVFFVHIFGFSGLFKLVLSTLLTTDISFLSFSNLDPLTETVSFKKKKKLKAKSKEHGETKEKIDLKLTGQET